MEDRKSSYEEMREVDIRTVDITSLGNLDGVEVDRELPREKRWLDFMSKIGNPFCFICNGLAVKVSYTDEGESLENKLVQLCAAMDENS